MFIPHLFKETNEEEINHIIDANPFGTLITTIGKKPIATHIPMLRRTIDGTKYITGHLAKENEQAEAIVQEVKDALVIFQGPHAYVSSSWYESENVPTWNYQVVHLYGKLMPLTEEELIEDLTILLELFETGRRDAVLWETISDKTKQQVHGIIGFKLRIDRIEAASKLSQNRNDVDYGRIVAQLERGDEMERQVASEMKKRRT